MRLSRPIKLVMKVHEAKCDSNSSRLMLNIDKKPESILNSSYSMIHTLEESFSIMMYSCIHNTETKNGCVHNEVYCQVDIDKRNYSHVASVIISLWSQIQKNSYCTV